jgi:hypothetical protein
VRPPAGVLSILGDKLPAMLCSTRSLNGCSVRSAIALNRKNTASGKLIVTSMIYPSATTHQKPCILSLPHAS